MNYISIQSSKDVIERFGIKGMRWGIKSRHADLRDNHTAYNTDPHDYVRNKSSYDKYNVRKEVKNAFRREGKIK